MAHGDIVQVDGHSPAVLILGMGRCEALQADGESQTHTCQRSKVQDKALCSWTRGAAWHS